MNKYDIINIVIDILIGIVIYNLLLPIVFKIEYMLSKHFESIHKRLFRNSRIFPEDGIFDKGISLIVSIVIVLLLYFFCPLGLFI